MIEKLVLLIVSAVIAVVLGVIVGVLFLPVAELLQHGELCLLQDRHCEDSMAWSLVIFAPWTAIISLVIVTPIIFFLLNRRK